MRPDLVPEGYEKLARVAKEYGMSENAVRLAARRRRVRAVLIRGCIYVHGPDLAQHPASAA